MSTCPIDAYALQDPAAPPVVAAPLDPVVAAEEQRFWERMSPRQVAIVLVRMQALWIWFHALLEMTYLPRYFSRAGTVSFSSVNVMSPTARMDLFFLLVRIALDIAVGILVICYAERLILWVGKDTVPKSRQAEVSIRADP